GYRRDGRVARCEGKNFEVRDYSVFCPKAFAQIRSLPDTTQSRCITVRLQRSLPGERHERWRLAYLKMFEQLRRQAARWAEDNESQLARLDPFIPETINDRVADNWRVLISIAERAGGDWSERARAAMTSLSGVENEEQIAITLLADLCQVFDELGPDLET